nr:MAG TPA: protein-turn-helix DNA binding protein [Caudoviricetes sp.]
MNPNQVLSVLVQEWMKRQRLGVKAAARRLRMPWISLQRRLNGLHPWSVDELLRLYDEGIHISSELFRAIVAEEEISA